jgi:hypothetical protein
MTKACKRCGKTPKRDHLEAGICWPCTLQLWYAKR